MYRLSCSTSSFRTQFHLIVTHREMLKEPCAHHVCCHLGKDPTLALSLFGALTSVVQVTAAVAIRLLVARAHAVVKQRVARLVAARVRVIRIRVGTRLSVVSRNQVIGVAELNGEG